MAPSGSSSIRRAQCSASGRRRSRQRRARRRPRSGGDLRSPGRELGASSPGTAVPQRGGDCAMLRGPMSPTRLPQAVLLTASLTLSCGAGPTGRQTTASNTRGDDPWLAGSRCTADTPADPAPRIEVVAEGTGQPVETGMTVRVHYVATLPNGAVLHDSHEGSLPSEIILGSTNTICGFERALLGMRPGEQRRATIPSALAFG